MSEASITRLAVRDLRRRFSGAYVRKIVGSPDQQSGIPDLLACVPYEVRPEDVGKTLGLFVGVEMKDGTNKPSRIQEVEIDRIRGAGGIAGVVRSPDEAVELATRSPSGGDEPPKG